jgi:hypothetical protein
MLVKLQACNVSQRDYDGGVGEGISVHGAIQPEAIGGGAW